MAEQERLAVTGHDQLWRNRAVESPHRIGVLRGEARMELARQRSGWVDTGIELRRHARVVNRVGRRLGLGHFDGNLRRELAEPLMRPDWSRWTAFDGSRAA